MTLQQIRELYETRQSCREFSSRPVEKSTVEEICDLARLAPSACNLQPWKVYALTGEKKRDATKYMQRLGMNKFLDQAPVLLVVALGYAADEYPTRPKTRKPLDEILTFVD